MTVLAAFATLVCQKNSVFLCKGTKAQEFCKAEFWESLPGFCGGILPGFCIAGDLYSKPGKSLCERIPLTFTTASRCLHSLTFGRHDRFCIWKLLFYQQPCAKAQEFCKAEFWESLPVSALVCVFACGTGILIAEFSVS